MDEKKPKSLMEGLNSGAKYTGNVPGVVGVTSMPNISNGVQMKQKTQEETLKEFEKLKQKLDGLKKKIIAKYKFTRFLSVLPQQALPVFAEDEGMPVEIEKTNPVLLLMCIPEEQFKNIPKIKPEVLKLVKESKENIWLMIKTEVDIWNYGLDSKFDLLDAVSASFPVHDSGFLGNLRLANIHKSLVLRKFEKYVASYVLHGSLVRGTAEKTSDVDTFVIIDDTDVKRMNRLELLEKLRGIIYDYIREANALSGVKNVLNVQVWLLTDFWDRVKNAEPVAFTVIRDGIPFYDRGTFIPWKLLLKMGKIKPSPEAIDMFMKSGDQNDGLVKRRLMDAMVDIFWGIVTPTQALMMLAGNAPPEPKIIVQEVKKILVDKEKLMSANELKFLDKVVSTYKRYEHGKLKEVSGKEIDELLKESGIYVRKMKELRGKIEERMQEHMIDKTYDEMMDLLNKVLGKVNQGNIVEEIDKQLVRKGKLQKRMIGIVEEIIKVKKNKKTKKLSQSEIQKLSAEASELIQNLMEYSQRKELVASAKGVLQISFEKGKAEVVLTDLSVFVVENGKIRRIASGKLIMSDEKELQKAIEETKDRGKMTLSGHVFEILKKEFGEFSVGF